MRLYLTRNQITKLMGGVAFELSAQVELTNEETELVRRYQASSEVLLSRKDWLGESLLTIGSLVRGQTFKVSNISEILAYEESVIEGCRTFKTYLEVMSGFGGTETIEFALVDGNVVENRLGD